MPLLRVWKRNTTAVCMSAYTVGAASPAGLQPRGSCKREGLWKRGEGTPEMGPMLEEVKTLGRHQGRLMPLTAYR
jgi:hypothetical protein